MNLKIRIFTFEYSPSMIDLRVTSLALLNSIEGFKKCTLFMSSQESTLHEIFFKKISRVKIIIKVSSNC